MEDSGSIRVDWEMHPRGRNEGPTVLVVDESSKSPLFEGVYGQSVDGIEQVERPRWKVMKLQMKRHAKDRQMTTLLLRDSARSGNTPRRSGHCLENGGQITFCLNMVRNGPMWQKLKTLVICNHNHMQPSFPQNPRNTQRYKYASNPHHPPKHLEKQPNTRMVLIPTLGEFTGRNRRTMCDKKKGPTYSL